MPENGSINEGTTGTRGGSTPGGTPGSGSGSSGLTGTSGTTGGSTGTYGTGGGTSGGTGTGTGAALSQQAQHYGERISEVATQAKDYVSDKVHVVGDKLKDLQNADLNELAQNAKDYARRNPGQALLISAGVGLLLGMLLRGRR